MSTPPSNEEIVADVAADLRAMASLIEAHPELAATLRYGLYEAEIIIAVGPVVGAQGARETLRMYVAAAREQGLRVSEYDSGQWGGVVIHFGHLKLRPFADKHLLGEVPAPPPPTYRPLLEPDCGRICCTTPAGRPEDCRCTRPADHAGNHVSAHVSWSDV